MMTNRKKLDTGSPLLAEKIKRLRKQRKLSQGELAEKIGINPNHLSRLETGKYQPSIELLKKLAIALEVSADYLLSADSADTGEIQIRNKSLAERMRLIDSLDEEDQDALIRVIDSMLTKHRMRQLLAERSAAAGGS